MFDRETDRRLLACQQCGAAIPVRRVGPGGPDEAVEECPRCGNGRFEELDRGGGA